ncbi:DUF4194 domain-containing protein [Nocardioides sp. ChNu-99]|uniref:DUF4194 domain-containing protein n=1 Tax=Nocardioides sp. ChNu-99 TaxID=2839897 RepID=UPI002405B7AE|nr:DUF4194 domain-containing protein [Nocardioides sp. ChNu-99]MDF9716709.1 DUF4194 domain-containing protein [Nocardioides sp. ChNu-99]
MSTTTDETWADARDGYDARDADLVPELEGSTLLSLFDGDEGGLPLAQRRALLALVKLRFVTARTHPREWEALLENPRAVASRLNDLFLELVLDREHEVAYKRQAVPEAGGRFPTLLHDTAWNREETIALVFLRNRHFTDSARGDDRVWVDVTDVVAHVMAMRPPHSTDAAGDEGRARNAVASLYKAGLLLGPATGDRFEVSPAVEALLPLERLQELLEWLRTPPPEDDRAPDEPVPADELGDAPYDGAPADDEVVPGAEAAEPEEDLEPDTAFDDLDLGPAATEDATETATARTDDEDRA